MNFNNIVNFFKRTCWLISSCRRTGETILSNYWQSPKITATVHYFHYNSQHHYHYYHFHYHFKMPLYRLQILLTILFTVIWSPVCFNWHLSSFYQYVFFFYYIILFVFLHPVKWVRIVYNHQTYFRFSLYTFTAIVIYTALFALTCLYLFTITYLYLSMFSLYYYMNVIKLIKYGKYRNYDETF